jgi:hypothetical protein
VHSTLRRIQIGLGTLAAVSLISLVAPAHVSAGTCYEVRGPGQGFWVCPWQ